MGDLFRCLEECALISVRLFIEALGMQGIKDGSGYSVGLRIDPKGDDVWVDDLGGKRMTQYDITNLPKEEREILGTLLVWANKELAHLTSVFETKNCDKHDIIRQGISIIENLIERKLYAEVGMPLPPTHTLIDHRRQPARLDAYKSIMEAGVNLSHEPPLFPTVVIDTAGDVTISVLDSPPDDSMDAFEVVMQWKQTLLAERGITLPHCIGFASEGDEIALGIFPPAKGICLGAASTAPSELLNGGPTTNRNDRNTS